MMITALNQWKKETIYNKKQLILCTHLQINISYRTQLIEAFNVFKINHPEKLEQKYLAIISNLKIRFICTLHLMQQIIYKDTYCQYQEIMHLFNQVIQQVVKFLHKNQLKYKLQKTYKNKLRLYDKQLKLIKQKLENYILRQLTIYDKDKSNRALLTVKCGGQMWKNQLDRINEKNINQW
ncbi:unnamed protein product [Paramecium sonneborni]|uniref:Uncharacterized protein n=1 Tax=Paramecium sonneborni TaxID=65129 RepID=A0A8S1MXX7_9CILI|nr:unnamed protein product [Paramecium sonneborni]